MKRLLAIGALLLLSSAARAERIRYIQNPSTGRPDAITKIDSTTIQAGSNITVTATSTGTVRISGTGGGTPGGSDTQVQYNKTGAFAGSPNFLFNDSTNLLTLYGPMTSVNNVVVDAPVLEVDDFSSCEFQLRYTPLNTPEKRLYFYNCQTSKEMMNFSASGSSVTITQPLAVSSPTTINNTLTVNSTGRFTNTLTLDSLIGAGNGYIPFVDASGTLTQYNFFTWDASNHRMGLGFAFPAYTIDANGGVRYKQHFRTAASASGTIGNTVNNSDLVYASGDISLAGSPGNDTLSLQVKNVAGVSINVSAANGDTVEGVASITLLANEGAEFTYNSAGTNWKVTQRYYVNPAQLSLDETFTGAQTFTSPSGSSTTYRVYAGSYTGAGLTTCGDATHALGYNASNLFTCQSITGTGGGVATTSSPTWTGSHLFAEAAGSNSIAIQPPVNSTGTGWVDGTSGALLLDNSNNTGVGVQLYTTGGGSNQAPPLYIRVTSSTFAQPNIYVNSDSTDPNNPGIRINTKWPKIDFVNTNLGGSVKYQFANPLAADYFQINGRRGDNSQFDTIVRLYRKGSSTNGGLGFNALMLMTTGQLMLNDGTDTNYAAFSASESVTASYQMVLPAAAGTANQFFKIASVSGSRSNLSFSGVSATTDLSGTLQAAQFPALTGDVTTAGGALATTLASSIAGNHTWTGQATFSSTASANAGFYFGGAASKSANYTMVSTDTVVFASAPLTTNGGITITLPSAANLGQTIRIIKVDTSSNPVTLAGAGSNLVVGTQTLVLPSFGASQTLISDGVSNWFPDGKIAASVPFIGHNFDPNGAAAVTASSNAYSNAVYVPEPCTVKGVRFVVGVQFGNMDVALLDSTGKRLGSSGGTAVPAPGIQSINLAAPTAILPGTYYLTMAVSNSTATFARYSIDSVAGNFVNTASYPIPANLALTTAGSRNFSLVGLVYGGVTQ